MVEQNLSRKEYVKMKLFGWFVAQKRLTAPGAARWGKKHIAASDRRLSFGADAGRGQLGPLRFGEEVGVAPREVVAGAEAERSCGVVERGPGTLDFQEIADGSLIKLD